MCGRTVRQRHPTSAHINMPIVSRCKLRRRLYLSAGAEQDRLTLQYYGEVQRLRLRVRLPPMVIPINPVRAMAPPQAVLWPLADRPHFTPASSVDGS